jgi:hypothetical protein
MAKNGKEKQKKATKYEKAKNEKEKKRGVE